MSKLIEMAQQAGFNVAGDLYGEGCLIERLEKFDALIRADMNQKFYEILRVMNEISEQNGEEL